MLALKDIPGIAPVLGGTLLAQSPIWTTPVDRIHPSQLMAFRTRLALSGNKAQADAALGGLFIHGTSPNFSYILPGHLDVQVLVKISH